MANIVCYDLDGQILNYYTQWDVDQKLVIAGADTSYAPDFHFLNTLHGDTYVVKAYVSGDLLTANVPDELLQYDVPIIVHICYIPGTTEYTVRIPVMPRRKPDNYIFTDTESGGGSSGSSVVIADNLMTNNPNVALSAAQGVVIKSLIDDINNEVVDKITVIEVEDMINNSVKDMVGSEDMNNAINSAISSAVENKVSENEMNTAINNAVKDMVNIEQMNNAIADALSDFDAGGSGGTGDDGATFIPNVDSSGNLSWTNNKGLDNPATVNIKGEPGQSGTTPERGVHYWTDEDIAEIQAYVDDAILGGIW